MFFFSKIYFDNLTKNIITPKKTIKVAAFEGVTKSK